MEEILASIRRIIADDEDKPASAKATNAAQPQTASKPAPMTKPETVAVPVPEAKIAPKPAPSAANNQDDIDALLAGFDSPPADDTSSPVPASPDILENDVFELTDDMALPDTISEPSAEAASEASFRRVDPSDDVEFAEAIAASERQRASAQAAPSHESPSVAPQPQAPFRQQQMLSQSTASSVESAFNALASTVLSNNARTLEDLVKEMLRPMLKTWLDDNLPGLVERIVKAEIERVSRGR